MELITRIRPSNEWRSNCKKVKIEKWRDGCGDGYKYIVDMGNPIINITYGDLNNTHVLRAKKSLLRMIIEWEQNNIIHRDLGIRAFKEVKANGMNNNERVENGMTLGVRQPLIMDDVYASLKIGLISLSINLYNEGRQEECEAIKNVLRFTPKFDIDDQLYNDNKELFSWVHT